MQVGCVSYFKSANESCIISCGYFLIFGGRKYRSNFIDMGLLKQEQIPVAERSKALVRGRSLPRIAGLNPTGDMGVCLL
jgi:hypothetical protein